MHDATLVTVVGVGASAGGVEAISELFRCVPPDTGLAFVVIMHLDPTHASQLVDVLSRVTAMPTCEAKDGLSIERDHLYVIPPNKFLHLHDGTLHLSPRPHDHVPSLPIDAFFRSLADDLGSRAIGIVLSGTGSDGSEGLAAIKAVDGITLAQDDTAQHADMPRNAFESGCVDFVLPPAGIAQELNRISHHPYLAQITDSTDSEPSSGDDTAEESYAELFRLLRQSSQVDYANYKRSTVGRRIQRRLLVNHFEGIAQYLSFVKEHPEELLTLNRDLLIHVTRFFRDVDAFEALKTIVFPAINAQRDPETPIRMWVAGCSTGEEVYSLAISLIEFLGERWALTPIKIFATDIGEEALTLARAACYSENIASDVSSERLKRYFVRWGSGYQIIKPIRDLCVFARHDMTSEPPFSNLDLISCRNVLIYFGPVLQKRVLPLFHYALKPDRFLFLGASETIGSLSDCFELRDAEHRIYSTKAIASRIAFDFGSSGPVFNSISKDVKVARLTPNVPDLKGEADRILLSHYAPPGVVINENMEILQFRGETGKYLAPAPGLASFHLLKMAREGLLADLRTVLADAKETSQPARRNGIRVRSNGHLLEINLQVIPLRFADQSCYAVLFEDVQAPSSKSVNEQAVTPNLPTATDIISDHDRQLARVNQELEAAKEYLQLNIEKVETSNEELRVANEEVISSNEELQSTNEELQTAKEELQASNEELNTVNDELRHRNHEATQLGDDLSNLLHSVKIPIVMVGPDLCVRRFTPPAGDIFRLISGDVGRPIADLNHGLVDVTLNSLILQVLESLTPIEREVRNQSGHWYRLGVRPYRTKENFIDGVVISLIDIDDVKNCERVITEARDYAEAILGTIHIPLAVLDLQRRIKSANTAFLDFFHVTRTETERHFLRELGNRQWDIPELDDLLGKTIVTGENLKDYFVRHDFPTIGRKVMLLNARRLEDPNGDSPRILLSIEDFTDRERAITVLRDERSREGEKMESIGRLAGGIAHDFNNLLTIILGYCDSLIDRLRADPVATDMLGQVRHAGERAARLTQQLLAYSCKQILQPREVDLNQLLTEMESMLSRVVSENIHIRTQLCSEPAMVKIDPSQMEQVVMNLCLNARDAIPDKGTLILETCHVELDEDTRLSDAEIPKGRYVRLIVQDTGMGMDAATLDRIFEPFYTTKEVGKGTGLGLATVQGIVNQSHGYIQVASQPNRGTTFVIYLPAVERRLPPPLSIPEAPADPSQIKSILVVEDEPAICEMIVKLLQLPQYQILQAANGVEALEVSRQYTGDIDLLITDVMMPGMTGCRLASVLKSTRPQLKVLYISGHSEDLVKQQGIAIDQVAFLPKPFVPADLLNKVAEELSQATR